MCVPFYFMILDLPFPRDNFVVSASRNASFIILFIFISENQTTFNVVSKICVLPIQMFLYIYLMHFKEILKKLIGNNVDPSFPQQIMFLIHVQ